MITEKKPTTREDIINSPHLSKMISFAMKTLNVPHDIQDDIAQTTALNLLQKKIFEANSVSFNIFQHTKWVYWNHKSKRETYRRNRIQVGYEHTPDILCEEKPFELDEFKEWYLENSRFLPQVDRDVLEMSYIQGMILEKIGETLGVTKERARQIRFRAIKKLREFYEES
jgi:RNA polymerase sigma factor (sigma-70 family)